MSKLVSISGLISIKDNSVRIDYEIKNQDKLAIYAYVLVIDGRRKVYPNDAFACVSSDLEVLQLLLGGSPIPDGISLNANLLPHAVLIKPHATYKGFIKLKLPIYEWHANSMRVESENIDQVELVSVRKIRLKVEYINQRDVTFREKTEFNSFFQVGGFPVHGLNLAFDAPKSIGIVIKPKPFKRFIFDN